MSGSLQRCFRNPRAHEASKTAQNGQKWPKMTLSDYYMVKLPKFLKVGVFQTKWIVIEPNYSPSFIYALIVKCIGLKEAQYSPLKSSKLTFWTKLTTK